MCAPSSWSGSPSSSAQDHALLAGGHSGSFSHYNGQERKIFNSASSGRDLPICCLCLSAFIFLALLKSLAISPYGFVFYLLKTNTPFS